MPRTEASPEEKMQVCGVPLPPSMRERLREEAAAEDRSVAYVARRHIARSMALDERGRDDADDAD